MVGGGENMENYNDFDIEMFDDGLGGQVEPASITVGISILISFTLASNSSTSIACATLTNISE